MSLPRIGVERGAVGDLVSGHAAQNRNCQLGANAADSNQAQEELLLARSQESEQRDGVFAHMGVNVQRYLGARPR